MLSRNRTGIPCAVATASPFIGARAPCVGRVGGQLGRGPHRVVDLGGDPHGVGCSGGADGGEARHRGGAPVLAQHVQVAPVGEVAEREARWRGRPRRPARRRRCGRRRPATPCGPCPGCSTGRRRRRRSGRGCGWPGDPSIGSGKVLRTTLVTSREHRRDPTGPSGRGAALGRRARRRRRWRCRRRRGARSARAAGVLRFISASSVTSPTGISRMPMAASSSSGVAGSPTSTRSAMPVCSLGRRSEHEAGEAERLEHPVRRASVWSWPVTACTISASTQCAEVGWYSYLRADRPVEAPLGERLAPALVGVPQRRAERRVREAGGVLEHVVEGDGVLAVGRRTPG